MTWSGTQNGCGYGVLSIGSRTDRTARNVKAHRLSASLWKGFKLESTLFVCHRCDNPLCINPDHLFIGTNADNCADCKVKGRFAIGVKNGANKLTPDQVSSIRMACRNGAVQAETARRFGVHKQTITNIVRRRQWKHVA